MPRPYLTFQWVRPGALNLRLWGTVSLSRPHLDAASLKGPQSVCLHGQYAALYLA